MTTTFLTVPGLSLRIGLTERHIRGLITSGVLSPVRVGRTFGFSSSDIPAIEAKLRELGHLPTAVPLGTRCLVPSLPQTA